ncbi:glutamate--tRNA ligase [Candidatus Micrarchaeota archaeon RBG_16_49_10]|nr:MAG: glutamate--tRNA ligase [Candidatus Micrarchaeota archaeon RBG_16_49_10]
MSARDTILKHTLLNALQYGGKADFKAVVGKIISENPDFKDNMGELIPTIRGVIEEVNSWGLEKVEEKVRDLGIKIEEKKIEAKKTLPELKNVKSGKIVMRMAPFPSGPLHIGNTRMAILNDEYVKKYGGKLILVIDDTIGSIDKIPTKEAYNLIKDGLNWMGVNYHETRLKSDRMEFFYEWAEKLIQMGFAYVCECDVEKMRKLRKEGEDCGCRGLKTEENLKKWKGMLKGKYKEGEAVVRLKTSMTDPNPAFRDRVLLRISSRSHPLVGNKYLVWPMLEFSWAIDDHFLGITHILRGKDLVIEDLMEKFIWDLMKWEHPELLHYGLLSIEGLKLSKSKARKAIDEDEYSGWEDPRTWSLQSLKKRGFRPEAVRNFILSFGMSMNDITVPADVLYTENRKIIEPVANRYFAVFEPKILKIEGCPDIKEVTEGLHPDFPERGKRNVPVNTKIIRVSKEDYVKYKGKTLRLMGLFNVSLKTKALYEGNEVIQEMPKIQWVSEKNVPIKIVMNDGSVIEGLAEPDIEKVREGEAIQFVRFGFCRLDDKKTMKFHFTHK